MPFKHRFFFCVPPPFFWRFLGPRGPKARRGDLTFQGGGPNRGGPIFLKGGPKIDLTGLISTSFITRTNTLVGYCVCKRKTGFHTHIQKDYFFEAYQTEIT